MDNQTVENLDVPWGGKRPGAGRKAPGGKLELLSVRVPSDTLKKLQAEAERRGVSLREVIEDLVRQLPGGVDSK